MNPFLSLFWQCFSGKWRIHKKGGGEIDFPSLFVYVFMWVKLIDEVIYKSRPAITTSHRVLDVTGNSVAKETLDSWIVVRWCGKVINGFYLAYNLNPPIIYIYMGSGRFPGPMELLQQLVRVSKTRWRWFNLNKSMLLQPWIKKLEVLVMINQWTTYCINGNNDERWMVVLIDFYLTFCKK